LNLDFSSEQIHQTPDYQTQFDISIYFEWFIYILQNINDYWCVFFWWFCRRASIKYSSCGFCKSTKYQNCKKLSKHCIIFVEKMLELFLDKQKLNIIKGL